MMSTSGGLKPRAVAGRPSVTRLTQRSWTGMRASGRPRAAVRKILSSIRSEKEKERERERERERGGGGGGREGISNITVLQYCYKNVVMQKIIGYDYNVMYVMYSYMCMHFCRLHV